MGHELAVFRIGSEFDDFNLIWHVAALAEAAPFSEPCFAGEFSFELLQIGGTERMIEGGDFDEALALESVEIGVRLGAGDADVLAGQRQSRTRFAQMGKVWVASLSLLGISVIGATKAAAIEAVMEAFKTHALAGEPSESCEACS